MKYLAILTALFITFIPSLAVAQDGYATSWQLGLQDAASPLKSEIDSFHNLLLVIITGITVFVTVILIYIVIVYRRRKGREPADFAHNTMIEVIWTIVPVIILIVIAIPSFNLLYFENRIPEPELTIKATGYQWYWGYEYTDYEGLDFMSYMIPDADIDREAGQRRLLSTDEPVVVPVDTNIQLLITAADVLHAFALPAAGVKKDAVPGQLNETWMRFDREGTFYGQCSEICGTGHSYMPIEVKVVSREEFDAWTETKGAKLKAVEEPGALEDKNSGAEAGVGAADDGSEG